MTTPFLCDIYQRRNIVKTDTFFCSLEAHRGERSITRFSNGNLGTQSKNFNFACQEMIRSPPSHIACFFRAQWILQKHVLFAQNESPTTK